MDIIVKVFRRSCWGWSIVNLDGNKLGKVCDLNCPCSAKSWPLKNTFLGGKSFVIITCFKQIFLGTKLGAGAQKIGEHYPGMHPRGYGLIAP